MQGRKLIVEVVKATWDWQEFFKPLGLSFSGIAASQSNPDVCHSKRFVNRIDLAQMTLPGWDVETPSDFATCESHPCDVIMCAKQLFSDAVLSQPPLLVWPNGKTFPQMMSGPTQAMKRNELGANELREYRKTAGKIAEKPWHMEKAAKYLREWCDANVAGEFPNPTSLGWAVEHEVEDVVTGEVASRPCFSDEWKQYAPQAATRIEVSAALGRQRMRGKQSARQFGERVGATVEDVGNVVVQLPPDDDPCEKETVVGGDAALVLGCSKCRWVARGCGVCRNPNFKGRRGPRE